MKIARIDNRSNLEFRKMDFVINYLKYPISSVLGILGNTIVLTSVSLSESLPDFCKAFGHGWITAEYRLLPSSTPTRNTNIQNSRAQEIKRMIGRVLRSAFDIYKFPKYQIIVDCDVLQADGGTRVTCINSAFLALIFAFDKLLQDGSISDNPIRSHIAAMSFAIENGQILLDPSYLEDSSADVDLNIVVTKDSQISELQFTAEKDFLDLQKLNEIIRISFDKAKEIIDLQLKKITEGGVKIVKLSNL